MTTDDMAGAEAPLRAEVIIRNQRGLHARAAAKFVKLAAGFDAAVEVARNGTRVGGDSIMGLMMLAASLGTTIALSARGPEAAEALAALVKLIEDRFDEE